MKSLKRIFKKKPIKQIADWSLWHELKRRELKDKFKPIGLSLKVGAIAMKELFKAMKNIGYTAKEFNNSLNRVKEITNEKFKS